VFELANHRTQVNDLTFTADSRSLVSCSIDGAILFWDLKRRKEIGHIYERAASPWCVAVDPHQRRLAVGGLDRLVRLYRFDTRQPEGTLAGHTDRVTAVHFLADGRTLLSGSHDGTIRRWDVQTRKEGKPLLQGRDWVENFAVFEDGPGRLRLAVGSSGYVALDDVVLERFPYAPGAAAFSPDGKWLAASGAGADRVNVWKLPEEKKVGPLPGSPISRRLAFSPEGKYLLLLPRDGLRVYEVATRRPVGRADFPNTIALAVSPDGAWIAIGGLAGTIKVLHLPSLLRGAR
jgi:WD40 repeat protein